MDSQVQTLQKLPLIELISMVEMNKSVYHVIEKAVKWKFSKKKLVLRRPYASAQNRPKVFMQEFNHQIDINYLPVVTKVLRYFGHLVVSLRIFNRVHLPENQFKQLYQHINAYCSVTLTELHLTNVYKQTFIELSNPFKSLENLTLDGDQDLIEYTRLSFGELFPSMRRLILPSSTSIWLYLLDQKFPQLEYLSTENERDYNTPPIKQLIKNNPQIRHLALSKAQPNLLEHAAVELPNLESLTLIHYGMNNVNIQNASLHFENLKSFIVDEGFPRIWPNITFGDHLEEFEISVKDDERAKLIEMILAYKKSLKILRLKINLDNFDIMQFVNADLSLVELGFNCKNESEIELFICLIESSKCLKKFELFIEKPHLRGPAFDALKKRFDNEWNVTKSDYCVYLNRK